MRSTASIRLVSVTAAVAAALAACSNLPSPPASLSAMPAETLAAAPATQLTLPVPSHPLEMAMPDAEIVPAVNLYQLRRHELMRPFLRAGADLDGDGVAEAVVYLASDACTATGCPLVVFKAGPEGYQPIGRAESVLPPIRVLSTTAGRWHDLEATGADGKPARFAMSGNGYAPAAADAASVIASGETLIASLDVGAGPATRTPAWPALTTLPAVPAPKRQTFAIGGDSTEAAGGQ